MPLEGGPLVAGLHAGTGWETNEPDMAMPVGKIMTLSWDSGRESDRIEYPVTRLTEQAFGPHGNEHRPD